METIVLVIIGLASYDLFKSVCIILYKMFFHPRKYDFSSIDEEVEYHEDALNELAKRKEDITNE